HMATQNMKELAQWDAANHTTLLVRKSTRGVTATFLRGDGNYTIEDLDLEQLSGLVAAVIKSSGSHSTGSFVLSIELAGQGSAPPPHGPGGGPGGKEFRAVLQAGAINVHMQARGLAETIQVAQIANVRTGG